MKIKYLGNQSTPKLDSYSPDFLDSIPRNNQHLSEFFGLDYWNAYEFVITDIMMSPGIINGI